MNQLVSIIIPTFNRAYLILETLQSIINQSYQNWECLIIDDGSNDNTKEIIQNIIKKDSRFQYFERPINKQKGVSACRNIGFEKSKGEFINFVDSDDIVLPNHIETHLKHFSTNEIDISITNAEIFIDRQEILKGYWAKNIIADDIILAMIKNDVLWAIGSVFWKKSSIKMQKPFLEDLISSEEWLFHIVQIINGCKYNIDLQTTFLVRSHEIRIGKINSIAKTYSIYKSRIYIYEFLKPKKLLNKEYELHLLKDIFFALRLTLKNKNLQLFQNILSFLFKNFFILENKFKVIKILFISVPIYFISKKGEKLFKI